MNLTFRQLQTFVEVMRTGSVSEAGRSLGRTQPAISAMITNLENEIGFLLFERERGRLVAKPEAHYFMEEAEHVLDRLTQSSRTLREIGNLEKGRLRIACNPASSNFFMPQLLAEFLKGKPKIEASLMMRSSRIVTDWIASQQYDIGFAESSEPRSTILSEDFALPCICALPKNDPLALKPVITPHDLDGRSAALLYEEHTTTIQTRKAFQDSGTRLVKRFELQTFLPSLHLVEGGLCYTICDGFTVHSYEQSMGSQSNVVFKPFEPRITLNMSLMTPAHRPKSIIAEMFTAKLSSAASALLKRLD